MPQKLDLLLITRGLAALSVVLWHVDGYKGELPDLVNIPGRTAVWLFFGISGYVIAYGFLHKRYRLVASDFRDFYINRFLRIYPLFIVVSLLALLVEYYLNGSSPISWSEIPSQLLAMQFNHDYKLNGVFWTLGIEIQFYLCAPLFIVLFYQRVNPYIILVSLYCLLLVFYNYMVLNYGWSFDGRNLVTNLPHFLAGIVACKAVMKNRPKKIGAYTCLVLALVLISVTNSLYHNLPGKYWSLLGIVLVDGVIVLLVMAHSYFEAVDNPRLGLTYRVSAMLGILSYGIYALHGYLIKYIPEIEGKLTIMIIASVFCAYVSYRLIEKPALNFKRKQVAHI